MNFYSPNGSASDGNFGPPETNWMSQLSDLWQWDHLAAEVAQESQARVLFTGQAGVGKSLLFNRLRGWDISGKGIREETFADEQVWQTESYGLFVLVDLPTPPAEPMALAQSLLLAVGDPTLIVYLLDSAEGVTPAAYRWIAAFRATGKPLLLALNKCDQASNLAVTLSDAELRLGMPVLPISALTGLNIETRLLPAMLNAVPRLAVPLGRELLGLRRAVARRVIRQAALFAGVVGAQPVPMFDLPVQVMVQVGMVLRIAAAYGHAPSGGANREVISTVLSSLGLRYLALYLLKFVPVLGWAVMGLVSATATLTIGEAAIGYYEAGAMIPLSDWTRRNRAWLRQTRIDQATRLRGRWQALIHRLHTRRQRSTIPTQAMMEEIPLDMDKKEPT